MNTFDYKKELDALDNRFKNSYEIYGKTLLTRGDAISGSRSLMFTNHIDQFVQIKEPEIPYYSTGWENVVGGYSDSYRQIEEDRIVVKKITKFEGFKESPYILLTYNKEKDMYDIIERKAVENLTEKYCYEYNNSVIDSLNDNDEIPAGTVLYKSRSFDNIGDQSLGNYRYGINALTLYWTDTRTTEDALIVSESFAKRLASPESDTIRVQVNDNDILINYYGVGKEIKSFPDIGEEIRDNILCVARRRNNESILFDLDNSRMNSINKLSDNIFYSYGRIIDVMVYSNKPEYLEEECNSQIKKYYDINIKYYQEIYDELSKYLDNNCSDDLYFMWQKAKDIIECKAWRDRDKKFSNLILEFKVVYESKLTKGSKLTGRYGDKGVISLVEKDENMPLTENGLRVDIICNQCGVVGRLNPGQLIEQNLSFYTMKILEEAETYDNYDDKIKLIFRYLGMVDQRLREQLINLGMKDKQELYNIIDEYITMKTMNITQEPYYSDFNIDSFTKLKEEFPFVKKMVMYEKLDGVYREMSRNAVVGFKYVIKLKHTPSSKFSARSVSFVNAKGIPTKSRSYKFNKSLFSTSPVRLGEMEQSILSIGIGYDLVTKLNLEHSASIDAREKLNYALYTSNIFDDINIDVSNSENRNVEILLGYMKPIGIQFEFTEQSVDEIDTYYNEDFLINPIETVELKTMNSNFSFIESIPDDYSPIEYIVE